MLDPGIRELRAQEMLENMILEWDFAEPDLVKFGEYVDRIERYARSLGKMRHKGTFIHALEKIVADASRLMALSDSKKIEIGKHLQKCQACGFLIHLYANGLCGTCHADWVENGRPQS